MKKTNRTQERDRDDGIGCEILIKLVGVTFRGSREERWRGFLVRRIKTLFGKAIHVNLEVE